MTYDLGFMIWGVPGFEPRMNTKRHEWGLTAENAQNAERVGQKSEIRMSKSETNPNGKREIGKPE